MAHWVIRRDIVQSIIENLDHKRMTLKAAKNYFSAYGVEIKSNSREGFIKKLCKLLKEAEAV